MLERQGKDGTLRASHRSEDTVESLNKQIEELQEKIETLKHPDERRFKEARAALDTQEKEGNTVQSNMCQLNNCAECVSHQSCGWCPVRQMCMEGDRLGPLSGNCTYWNFDACATECKDHLVCDDCLSQQGCGFCHSSCSCMEARGSSGPDFGHCSGGWYHASGEKTCPEVQRMPGDRSDATDISVCLDRQYRYNKMREVLDKVDKSTTWRIQQELEKSDRDLW